MKPGWPCFITFHSIHFCSTHQSVLSPSLYPVVFFVWDALSSFHKSHILPLLALLYPLFCTRPPNPIISCEFSYFQIPRVLTTLRMWALITYYLAERLKFSQCLHLDSIVKLVSTSPSSSECRAERNTDQLLDKCLLDSLQLVTFPASPQLSTSYPSLKGCLKPGFLHGGFMGDFHIDLMVWILTF